MPAEMFSSLDLIRHWVIAPEYEIIRRCRSSTKSVNDRKRPYPFVHLRGSTSRSSQIHQIQFCNYTFLVLPHTRCTSTKCVFFLNKLVKFGRIIKSAIFKICSIACYTFFASFGHFVNTTPGNTSPFAENHSSNHFFTSSYEPRRCSASAWPIDANKW